MLDSTKKTLKRFSMSYEEYCCKRPWEVFSISRQGFEIALTTSSKKSCDKLKTEYTRLNHKSKNDSSLQSEENNNAFVQDKN